MTAPPLSVAMAVHDGMPFVEESVRSILAQTFGDFEFVVGDDGSSDGTTEVLRAIAAEDRRIRLLRRERKSGLAGSANWVVGETRAPLVAVAHADDVSRPERLEREVEAFESTPDAVLVGTLCDGIDESGRRVQPATAWRLRSKSPFAPFPHSSVMFRREAFLAAGGYRAEAEYWEDFDLYLRLSERGRILVVPEELTSVRHSRGSTRLRDDPFRVFASVDRMYRTADAFWNGAGAADALRTHAAASPRLHPLAFVSRGSIRLWSGRRPHVLLPMLRRGDLQIDLTSLQALAWALWGEISPRSLRSFIAALVRLRNRRVARHIRSGEPVEWRPRPDR